MQPAAPAVGGLVNELLAFLQKNNVAYDEKYLIGGALDDKCGSAHFADDASEVGKQIPNFPASLIAASLMLTILTDRKVQTQ